MRVVFVAVPWAASLNLSMNDIVLVLCWCLVVFVVLWLLFVRDVRVSEERRKGGDEGVREKSEQQPENIF